MKKLTFNEFESVYEQSMMVTEGENKWKKIMATCSGRRAGGEPTKSIVYFFGRVSLQSLFGRINFQFLNLLVEFYFSINNALKNAQKVRKYADLRALLCYNKDIRFHLFSEVITCLLSLTAPSRYHFLIHSVFFHYASSGCSIVHGHRPFQIMYSVT